MVWNLPDEELKSSSFITKAIINQIIDRKRIFGDIPPVFGGVYPFLEDFWIQKGASWNNNEIWVKTKGGIDSCYYEKLLGLNHTNKKLLTWK